MKDNKPEKIDKPIVDVPYDQRNNVSYSTPKPVGIPAKKGSKGK